MGESFFVTLAESEMVRSHFHQTAREYQHVLADHVVRSRELIAASRDLLAKVDGLLEKDSGMSGGTKRAMLQDHLLQADRHVSLGECHLARQRDIVAVLECGGLDTGEALKTLLRFEELQATHTEDRDRLRKELSLSS